MRLVLLVAAPIASLLLGTAAAVADAAETRIPDRALEQAAHLRERALADDTGWKVVESLTTEIGPRLAGSQADARAVAWAQAKFRELGFDRVWTEPVTFPRWVRRGERAEVLGPHAQPLTITALGGSPGGTIEGEVVRFADLAALEAAPDGSLAGKIAFVDYRMAAARDGSGYGKGSAVRSRGPSLAIRKGAGGFLMRSAGTDNHRVAHTGITRFDEGLAPVPAAALSIPDADQLARLAARGPVRVRLEVDAGWDGEYTSQNVIGEITGSRHPEEVVLIGGHLDSWDLGTGAVDDAAGIGITMAAAHLIGQLPQRPARTVRVVAYANEEQGLHGGRAYADAHAGDAARHQLSAESDFGAGRIYAFNTGAPEHAREATRQIAQALAPLGIEYAADKGGPGPDIGPLAAQGATWAWLAQDGSDYFHLHHTADDTLDKIDPAALAQNVAAYAVFAYLAAEAEGDFGSGRAPAQPGPASGRMTPADPAGAARRLALRLIDGPGPSADAARPHDAGATGLPARLPDAWDETRKLAGNGDGPRVVARRSGRDWFIGIANDTLPRRLELDLDFLPAADYEVTLWRDGDETDAARREERRIDAGHRTLALDLAAGAGAVAHLAPPSPRTAAD